MSTLYTKENFMDIKIRDSIINNFRGNTKAEIRESIEQTVNSEDEIVLPGLGVFFELLWNSSDEECKSKMLDLLEKNI